jgi:hypothetical protein
MKRSLASVLWIIVFALSASGQESPYAEDLRFINELRARGYSDLARNYLERLAKNAPPAMRNEFALEGALIEMEAANDEPDSSKRIELYRQARDKFQQFLNTNKTHPRAAEARFDIAKATTLLGKAELSRARLETDPAVLAAEGAKARGTFEQAAAILKQLPKTPDTELAIALNLLDQSETYLNTSSDADTAASSDLVQKAGKLLEPLASGESSSKITWLARAWSGRCLELLDSPAKAIDKYQNITGASGTPVREGKRLASYFVLLACRKAKETADKKPLTNDYLIRKAREWLTDYPSYRKTPEGYGIQYLLAESLLTEAEDAKTPPAEKRNAIVNARRYLSEIERTENDFTDRAKALKLAVLDKQGTFKLPIAKLNTFEDCFARAQFEQREIGKDAKKFADNKQEAEAAKKEHLNNIIAALRLGLTKPDAEKLPTESNLAQALLTYYLVEEKKYPEAIVVGEAFVKAKPNVSQAATAAIYTLLSHGRLLAERESKASDAKELKSDPQYQAAKEKMLAFARRMTQLWPKERAGNVARHELASLLIRDEKTSEAIKELAAITSEYPSYVSTQFLMARAALQLANQDKDKGDPNGYQMMALDTLNKLPEPGAAADPEARSDYIQGKLLLALEWYKQKKLNEVDLLLAKLKPQIETWRLDSDDAKEKEKRKKFEDGRVQLMLYSAVLQASNSFKAGKYQEVVKRLDPLVDQFNSDHLPQLKESEMGPGLIGLNLRANVQINNLERARVAVKALQLLQTEKDAEKSADSTTTILAQLVGLITQQVDELRKKGDAESLQKAKAGFTSILSEVAGGQKKPTAKLAYLLARCYAGMDEHQKAVDLLITFASEAQGADPALHHAIQLLLVEEYRRTKKTDEARTLLDEILKGKDGKGGWGAKNIDAQKSLVLQLEEEQKYSAAALICDKYVKQLVRRLDDNKLKDYYFDFYYHLVYSILKHGQSLSDSTKKAKSVHDAAQRMVALEKAQGGFGNDESRKRFEELLEKEPNLRQEYNALKGGK